MQMQRIQSTPLRTLQVRVKRGAEFLDKHLTDWANDINRSWLNITDCNRCILGQLDAWLLPFAAHEMAVNGFMGGNANDDWTLRRLWLHQIKKRRTT